MTTDQELHDRLTEILRPREDWHPDDLAMAVDAILADVDLLDGICEYRARQLDEERFTAAQVAYADHFTAVVGGFVRAQMYREAAASVALDHGDIGTYSVGIPYPAPESDPDKPV
jgi:hypothetical protein